MIDIELYFWFSGLKIRRTSARCKIDRFFNGLKCYEISLVLL